MYYPKQYHYIQEIQKFNVADYRPRFPPAAVHSTLVGYVELTFVAEWNNSKKRFEKYDKCSACENNAVMPSPKGTRGKCDLLERMIQRSIVASMAK